jgi:transketolase
LGTGSLRRGKEAADVASKYSLENLTVLLDYNKLQQYGWPGTVREREIPVMNPRWRWESFGWNAITIDGHDMMQFADACGEAAACKDRPTIIIAETVKGKGVSFMENNYQWHAKVPNSDELSLALAEIGGEG